MLFQHKEILSDEALLRLVRLGDDDGLSILHKRFDELVIRVATAIVGDRNRAKAIRQEVFSLVSRQASEYSLNQGSAKSWILRKTYCASFGCLMRSNTEASADRRRARTAEPARSPVLGEPAAREKRKRRPAETPRRGEKGRRPGRDAQSLKRSVTH